MHKLFGRILMLPLIVVAALSFSSQAFAADTWLPQFNANQHVYVEPALTTSATAPVNVSGLEQDLVQAGQKRHLQIYFIMAERGSESVPNAQFGTHMIDRLMAQWQSANGFPSDDYLVITVFRLPGGDWQKTARGGNPGPHAQGMGISLATLQSILDAPKARLANNDVRGYVRAVAGSVNSTADQFFADQEAAKQRAAADAERQRQQQIADAERARQQAIEDQAAAVRHAQQMEQVKTGVEYGGPPLAIIITLIVLFVIARRKRGQAEALLVAGRKDCETLGTNYTDLQDKGLGFLDTTLGWETRLKNRSLAEVKAAITLYSQLTAAKLALSDRLDKAEAAFAGQKNPFGWGGYNTVITLYTVAEVTVTGAELSQ